MTPGQLTFWLIRAGLFGALLPKRLTVEWSQDELDYLGTYYCLDGLAAVAAQLWRSPDSVKQMAARLDLLADMAEYTPLVEVAREAGVSSQALHNWLKARPRYRRLCRTWGGNTLLLPAPLARLYLHATRTDQRPPGWWGSARAAAHLGVSIPTLHTLDLTRLTCGRTAYFDPHEVQQMAETYHQRPPLSYLPLSQLAQGGHRSRLEPWLRSQGHPVQAFRQPHMASRSCTPAPTLHGPS